MSSSSSEPTANRKCRPNSDQITSTRSTEEHKQTGTTASTRGGTMSPKGTDSCSVAGGAERIAAKQHERRAKIVVNVRMPPSSRGTNLIGKRAAKDVSKAISASPPTAAFEPQAGTHRAAGAFPANISGAGTSAGATDAARKAGASAQTLSGGEALVSKLTTMGKIAATAKTTTTTTMQNCLKQKPPRVASAAPRTPPTAPAAKSKSSENKCSSEETARVSNQRKLEASSSQHPTTETQCEPLEYDQYRTTSKQSAQTTRKDIKRILNLAERKAILKSDFFKETRSREVKAKRNQLLPSSNCELELKTARDEIARSELRAFQLNSVHTVLPEVAVDAAAYEPVQLSLVAQRKLDLQRQFEQQSSTKTANRSPATTSYIENFPRVGILVKRFDTAPQKNMTVHPNKMTDTADANLLSLKTDAQEQRNSPLSDEGCNLGQSPYSSDNEDTESIRTAIELPKRKDKVARSASSDSALGLDVDDPMDVSPAQPPEGQQMKRRMTLTVTDLPLRPALLPLAEPTALPDSPSTVELQQTLQNLPVQTAIPTKVLLEERVVEIPEDPRSLGCSLSNSRRESAQSCGSDYNASECGGRRFVRTPSVVVSDYSDDIMCGISLEEIEYFRALRMRRRHSSLDTAGTEKEGEGGSDVSASSSCSNLYYCGSTISALDGVECLVNGVRMPLQRKTSDCSTCSASGDEDAFTIPEQPEDPSQMAKDLVDLLAAQHLSSKRPKKVGLQPVYGAPGEKAVP